MKRKVGIAIITALLAVFFLTLAACSAASDPMYKGDADMSDGADSTYSGNNGFSEGFNYRYNGIKDWENGFISTDRAATSYFSLDKNTAAYSLVRKQLTDGKTVAPDSIRAEEIINYFDYDFEAPETEAIKVTASLSDCPWNKDNKLLTFGIRTAERKLEGVNGNYVVLIDVSGSMREESRLGLAKKGINTLIDSLGEGDKVSVVTYANGSDIKASGLACTEENKVKLKQTVDELQAFGNTNGSEGLENAYRTAQNNFIEGGNNRVIMISDGDFNVGTTSAGTMKEFVKSRANGGVYLSVIGVGMGNMRDDMLETLATAGNGNYAYLDNEEEAKKVFSDGLNGMLMTVAKDVKAAVTFSDNVQMYRLIGYDNKHMSAEDYDSASTDAGEIGSNLSVAVIYEVKLKESVAAGKIATAEIKYKDVRGEKETNEKATATVTFDTGSSLDAEFAACVAEFALVLQQSIFAGEASAENVIQRLEGMKDYLAEDKLKQEFKNLVLLTVRE